MVLFGAKVVCGRNQRFEFLPEVLVQVQVHPRKYGPHTHILTRNHPLTGANRNTVKVHLRGLVEKRLLVQEGKGKGTWYHP